MKVTTLVAVLFMALTAIACLLFGLAIGQRRGSQRFQATIAQAPPVGVPAQTFASSDAEARERYPDLNRKGSPLNMGVAAEVKRLQALRSNELQAADAPMIIAQRVASRLGIVPVPPDLEVKFAEGQHYNNGEWLLIKLGGYNPDGSLWQLSGADAVRDVAAGHCRLHAYLQGRLAPLAVTTSLVTGTKTLRVQTAGVDEADLYTLPALPGS